MKEKNIYLYTKMLKYEMIRYLIEIDPIKNYNDNNKTNKIYKINNKIYVIFIFFALFSFSFPFKLKLKICFFNNYLSYPLR